MSTLRRFIWLFDSLDSDSDGESSNRVSRVYYLAQLEEAAGQRNEALANYKSVLSHTPPHSGTRWEVANAGVKRLSGAH